ncbi:serine hydrolase domain-containing protein [Nocardia vinacea]|uniref:serine hydrolase domain-containing protein n=1 Tax=Nocardia vinacea TaxID=96468 RepID=UPI000592D5C9|nr:serine hydrolase domain-containing protein [Nocardia vinacea]
MSVIERSSVRDRVEALPARRAMVGSALAVVRAGRLEFFSGNGFADLAAHRPMTVDTVVRVASITKTFTAIGVMQLVQRGLIDLDVPAERYLRAFPLVPADPGFRPATVRHLLTHTAGIGETAHPARVLRPDFGESVALGTPIPALADYYRGGLCLRAEPGTRWTYSNHGFAALGQIIADVSGISLAQYLRENIFRPLGMTDTDLELTPSMRARLATGYRLRGNGPRAIALREMVTAGAASAYSTPRDMARYLAALSGGGANEFGAIVESSTLATMFEPQYQPDRRIPGMGLAFFRGVAGGHRIVEHQGILPGFDSQIWVAPDDGLAIFASTNGAHRAMLWLPAEVSELMNDLLGVRADAIRTDVGHHPEIWNEICGYYRLPGALTDLRARSMIGAGVQVRIHSGRPVLRLLTPVPSLLRGLPLHPDDPSDPWVFRVDLTRFGIGTGRIVFKRAPASNAMHMHFDLVPMTLLRRGDR